MTDKEYSKEKRRVEKLLEKWIKPLGLGWWMIDISYSRDFAGDTDGFDTVAECSSKWYYRIADVKFYLPAVARIDDARLEVLVVHELMHIFVNEMREKDEDRRHEEHVVTGLANAIVWAVNGTKK